MRRMTRNLHATAGLPAVAISLLLLPFNCGLAIAGAFNFQEPDGWTIGDVGSTFQEWNVSDDRFEETNTPPTAIDVNPSVSSVPGMGVASPGFVGGSGGYYSFSDNYSIHANVFNHGGPAGTGGPYPASAGTRVFVQTAATMNEESAAGGPASVFPDSLKLVKHDSSPLVGGDPNSVLQVTQVFLGDVLTSFGIVPQQELLFEFFLPNYAGDFRVEFQSIIHSSFQHLRVDSLIVEPELDPDFDGSGTVDGLDFLQWQRDPAANGGADGLALWEAHYGEGGELSAIAGVPEPSSALLLILGMLGIDRFNRNRQSSFVQ